MEYVKGIKQTVKIVRLEIRLRISLSDGNHQLTEERSEEEYTVTPKGYSTEGKLRYQFFEVQGRVKSTWGRTSLSDLHYSLKCLSEKEDEGRQLLRDSVLTFITYTRQLADEALNVFRKTVQHERL